MIDPRDSAWFSAYDKEGHIIDVHSRNWFKSDTLGLQTMEKDGKIHFLSLPGGHMHIPLEDLKSLLGKYFFTDVGLDYDPALLQVQ